MRMPVPRTQELATRETRLALWLEWLLIFIGLPLALRTWVPPESWPYLLVAAAALGWGIHRRRGDRAALRGPLSSPERRQLRVILKRFAACAAALTGTVALAAPLRLWEWPLPGWEMALLLATYPLLSVYPQELVYRELFLRRYALLFPGPQAWMTASAAAFAWLHVIFGNLVAPALTLLGGLLFAQTYLATRSLRLTILEHTLYGGLVFLVGIGEFFYHARA